MKNLFKLAVLSISLVGVSQFATAQRGGGHGGGGHGGGHQARCNIQSFNVDHFAQRLKQNNQDIRFKIQGLAPHRSQRIMDSARPLFQATRRINQIVRRARGPRACSDIRFEIGNAYQSISSLLSRLDRRPGHGHGRPGHGVRQIEELKRNLFRAEHILSRLQQSLRGRGGRGGGHGRPGRGGPGGR